MSKFADFNSPELHIIKSIFNQLYHLQLDINIAYIVEQYIYSLHQESFYLKKDTLITEQFTTRFGDKHANYRSWYSNNPNLKYEHSFYINGLLEGESKKWAISGNIMEERIYSKGKLNGLATDWWFHGLDVSSKWKECYYTEGKREGLYTEWYPNSEKKHIECFYTNDKLNGEYKSWYFISKGSNKKTECFYSEDKIEGEYKSWYPISEGGNKMVECCYVDDKRHGEYKSWYPISEGGNKYIESFYKNGLLDGEYKEYSRDEEILIQHIVYKDGNIVMNI